MKRKSIIGVSILIIMLITIFVIRKNKNNSVNDKAKSSKTDEHGHDEGEEKGHAEGEKASESGHADSHEHGESDEAKHSEGESDGHGHGHEEEAENEIIEMNEEKIKLSKIETAAVAIGTVEIQKSFTGEIKLNEDRLARIIPRFSGVVRSVNVSVGQSVGQGQTLMLIESNESLTTYEVKSPIKGIVIEKNIAMGAKADADAEAFLVADLSTVWVEINVYANDLQYVKKGQGVTIVSQGSNKSIKSTVSYVGPIIHGQSRTATARVVLDNKSGDWLPGMFISANIAVDKEEAGLVIPDSAIQTVEGKPSVFLKVEKGFKPQEVKQGKSDGSHVQITNGLNAGDIIAIENTFILKAELGKGEAKHSHD